jgi:hypothetical protein
MRISQVFLQDRPFLHWKDRRRDLGLPLSPHSQFSARYTPQDQDLIFITLLSPPASRQKLKGNRQVSSGRGLLFKAAVLLDELEKCRMFTAVIQSEEKLAAGSSPGFGCAGYRSLQVFGGQKTTGSIHSQLFYRSKYVRSA